ncbi:MAG: VTT domain-containing protein [Isosphaeraceae bacterium]
MTRIDLYDESRWPHRLVNWARRWALIVQLISAAAIVLSLLAIARRLPIAEMIAGLSNWVQKFGVWGPVVYGLIYAVAVVALIPGSALTLAAGALFGLVEGTITVSLASTTGAALAFLIARYLARDAVSRRVGRVPSFEAVDRAIGEGGWKIVALLRLSPAVPFILQNYLYGLTRIRFWPCVLTSWVAMLPGTIVYVYFGVVGRAGLESASGWRAHTPAEWAMIAVGLMATIAVSWYITRLARRAMRDHAGIATNGEELRSFGEKDHASPPAGWPWVATVAAVLALVAVAGAVYVQMRPDALHDLLVRLGGPPRVLLKEVHAEKPGGPTVDHHELDEILKTHVEAGGWVDYRALARDTGKLDAYIARLADAPFDELGRDEKLALLINAYNAFTLRLILDHYPIDSILKIPADRRWDAVRWRIGRHVWSLNQIEHEQIRPRFREPRVHFALVCAAIGCPPLRGEAYAAKRLDGQLGEQARYVHEHRRWFQFSPGESEVSLTSLYRWYGGDFEQVVGSVLAFAAGYVPALQEALEAGQRPEIRWLDYDWSLNFIENKEKVR